MKRNMKRAWKRALAFLLVIAMELSVVNVPVVYAQENVEAASEYLETNKAETESEMQAENGTTAGSDADIPTDETGIEEWDQKTTEKVFEGENYKVTFTLASYWDTGYNANIKLENIGDGTIQNWCLGFDYDNAITNIWNAEVSEHNDKKYVIKNAGWNQDIAVGGSIEFGISGNHAFRGFPENYELIGTSTEVKTEDYTIEYRVESDWGIGFTSSISITNNTDTALEDWVLEFDFDREITEIWNGVIEEHEGSHYVVRNATYNSTIALRGSVFFGMKGSGGETGDEPDNYVLYSYKGLNKEIDLNLDTDNDGAPDYIEDYFGTDKNKTDTDGDGLSDFIELYSLVLDPLNVDTDGNGVADGDEDLDGDGLSNLSEIEIGTSIFEPDTDEDGLSDADEIRLYGTNPLLKDTDSDGVSDSKEIELGTNPLVYEDAFALTVKAESTDTVKVSVETVLSGEQVESLTVKKYENDFFFPTDMPGYIGGAYDFSVDGSFDKAILRFEFDEALLEDTAFDPIIYYFNEGTQLLEALDTRLEGNVASTEVTHFSKYVLLNRKVFESAFEWQDVWSTTGYSGVEVVLVIDDSGSMDYNDGSNQRLSVAQTLIDKLPSGSKVGIVKFTNTASKLTSSLTDDKEIVKKYLTTEYFKSNGSGSRMYAGINSAFSLFGPADDSILRMMVVLSDGEADDTGQHATVVRSANTQEVQIHTVGLGSSTGYLKRYFDNYLKPLASNTAGVFYLASQASDLAGIYDKINQKIDISIDTDGDGIPDFYEDNMVMFNGVKLQLDKRNPDTDGDGLPDGGEVVDLNYQYNSDKTQVIVTGKLLSNPLDMDTDRDGLPDGEEMIIGTDPNKADTDNDGLNDGFEYINGFDPLEADIDEDGRLDFQEYIEGTDPYEYNKEWCDYTWEFICGFVAGDFIEDTDSLPTVMGQIASSFIPYVDIRDVVGNISHGDYVFASLSALGLVPIAGDAAKAVGKVGKFAVKNVDDIPKIADLLEYLSKNFPDAIKVLSKSDEFADAAKQLSKTDNIKLTRKQMKLVTEAFENAGLSHHLIKTSNSLNLKEALDISAEVWEKGWSKRGFEIEDFLTDLYKRKYLGKNFPVADTLSDRTLISTKSLDIAAQSYQDPNKLKYTLEKYAEALQNIEKKYFDASGNFTWGKTTLSTSEYDKKALEIVLPDVIITEDSLRVLNEFQAAWAEKGIEVWYRVTK
ncbi:MAG: cellulose binding domain-containing protein [Acetatifactor sp.]|nr:cellulose binding domain-containing protein [Acetatifactor sp.]